MGRVGTVTGGGRAWQSCLLAFLALALSLSCAPEARAQNASSSSSATTAPYAIEGLRALYLLHFIRLTDWPESALPDSAPYVVGVSGQRGLEDELVKLAERQIVRDRRLRIVRVRTPRDLENCHLVYFGTPADPTEEPGLAAAAALPALAGKPVLTVSDSADFIVLGGMVNLFREGGNLRFEIALETAEKVGLSFSARLLALARIVRPEKPTPESPGPSAP